MQHSSTLGIPGLGLAETVPGLSRGAWPSLALAGGGVEGGEGEREQSLGGLLGPTGNYLPFDPEKSSRL